MSILFGCLETALTL